LLVALVVGLQYFIEYRDWMGVSRRVTFRTAPGPCTTVSEGGGSEDVKYIGNNIALITTGFNLESDVGAMKALDLTTNKVVTLNMTNAPDRPDFMASPHGMTTWRDPDTDQLFVYVITHPVPEDKIEVFEVSKSLTLQYVKTITDPNFIFMNSLVAVGKDKFYITRFWRFRQKAYIVAEWYARLKSSGVGVMYYDGHRAREVTTGSYLMTNGINVSPDKSMVYVAEFGAYKLHGFRRESTNNLVKVWTVDVETGVDNIDVDPDTGDLWIGCHPHMYKIMDFYNFFGFVNPSQVIRVKMRDQMVSSVEQIYSDDGHELVGSTTATYVNGKLIIGTVSAQTVVCDVKYLSP